MRYLLITILLSFTINAQTIWYVDRDAAGSANGTSWANAWRTFESINWSSISAGDTIYVSDGTYIATADNAEASIVIGSAVTPYTFASGNPVVIARAWEAGHNGDVIITYHNVAQTRVFEIYGVSNIELYGMTFQDMRTNFYGFFGYIGGWEISANYDSLIILNNCHYISAGHNQGFYFTGHKTVIENSIFENLENSGDDPQDMFGIAGGSGEITFDNNLILNRSTSLTTTEHADGIQFSNFGMNSNNTVDIVIKNNIILHLGTSVAWTGLVYSSNPRINCNFYVYNNIIGTNNPNATTCDIILNQPDSTDTWIESIFIFNNTLITHGDGTGLATPIVASNDYPHKGIDTILIKNNLFIMDAPVNQVLNLQINFGTNVHVRDIDYNRYYEYGGLLGNFNNGDGFGAYTWTDWLGQGYDAHSDTGNSVNMIFSNKFDTLATGYYTVTGRDSGVDLSVSNPDLVAKFPDIAYDILGNPRTGAWDIGALEYRKFRSGIFLHHSTGENIWDYGISHGGYSGSTVPSEIAQMNSDSGYTGEDAITMGQVWFPGGAYSGDNEWSTWHSIFDGSILTGEIESYIDTNKIIVIKSCYPSSAITGVGSASDTTSPTTKSIYNYKWHLRNIVDAMKAYPDNFFVIWTNAPLETASTNSTEAGYADAFCTWMKDTLATGLDSYGVFPSNVYIFDFFHLLAGEDGIMQTQYRTGAGDSHPNATASDLVAPIFVNEIFGAAIAYEGYVPDPPPAVVDTIPSFSFTALNNMELNTTYTANSTFSGADSTFTVYTTTGARFQINSGGYSTTAKTAVNGDVVYVETVTGASYSTGYTETIVAGGVSRDFTVTTKAYVPPPSGNGGVVRGANGVIWKDANGVPIKVAQ